MKIPRVGNEISKYINESTVTPSKKPAEKSSPAADVPRRSGDDAIVNVSHRSKEALKAQQIIQSQPDVRLEKLRAIQEKIENGTYQIDYEKTAENILNAYLGEIT